MAETIGAFNTGFETVNLHRHIWPYIHINMTSFWTNLTL